MYGTGVFLRLLHPNHEDAKLKDLGLEAPVVQPAPQQELRLLSGEPLKEWLQGQHQP